MSFIDNEFTRKNINSHLFTLSTLVDEDSRLSYFFEMLDDINRTRTNGTSFTNSRIEKVLSFVEQHYADANLRLEDAANVTALIPTSLCTFFKKHTGLSFVEHLTSYRIGRSRFLLEHTEQEIGDILLLCGFNNRQMFNRQFLKYTGQTPSEYRRRSRIG